MIGIHKSNGLVELITFGDNQVLHLSVSLGFSLCEIDGWHGNDTWHPYFYKDGKYEDITCGKCAERVVAEVLKSK